ncbi:MAG: magnesium-translocating P-type ATPase [Clostridiaceae bacterium]
MKTEVKSKVSGETTFDDSIYKKIIGSSTVDEVYSILETSSEGINTEEASKRFEKYGPNEISDAKVDGLFKQIFNAFASPFTVVLLLLALISFFTDVVFMKKGEQDFSTTVIIIVMVLISGGISFVQDHNSRIAVSSLMGLIKNKTMILRKGEAPKDTDVDQVVPGDLIELNVGDIIPCDLVLVQAKDLLVDTSSLTGESLPVEKKGFNSRSSEKVSPGNTSGSILDNPAMVYMGSVVTSGSANAIAVTTGNSTYFGSIAKALEEKPEPNSFDKGIASVSTLLVRFMMVMVPIVLLINGITKGNWLEAFLYAMTVAVGLTPEMLPMILTTNLAKGAGVMAKKKTIVKDLSSIQTFGSMDILCTDKTGTLTQNRVELQDSLDVKGVKSDDLLLKAYLNAHMQNGSNSPMDIALENSENAKTLFSKSNQYSFIDEIPYDFNRRRASVVVASSDSGSLMITKGAVDEMLKASVLGQNDKDSIKAKSEEYNEAGYRVLLLGEKIVEQDMTIFEPEDEKDLNILGYLLFLDPPKESAANAVTSLQSHGITVRVLTGDSPGVAKAVCGKVGIPNEKALTGDEIEAMSLEELKVALDDCYIFAKLTPLQKERLVETFREKGHIVGYMGDGVNDATALKKADIGISVDSGVDIAKQSANIILLENDLNILDEGVVEGRSIFGNIMKYLKMTTSSNFGNVLSILVAGLFLPFLPMISIQMLLLNLLSDFSGASLPWDNVDKSYLEKPQPWDAKGILRSMLGFGPVSSIFDLSTFFFLFFFICPMVAGGKWGDPGTNKAMFIIAFHTGWFFESLLTQTLVMHVLRTEKLPFIQSWASKQVIAVTTLMLVIGFALPYSPLAGYFGLRPLPPIFYGFLVLIILGYFTLTLIVKRIMKERYGAII